jgi:MFS family permease
MKIDPLRMLALALALDVSAALDLLRKPVASLSSGGRPSVSVTSSPASALAPVFVTPLPIMAAVFISFLIIGLALPVLPLHVHQGLGQGTVIVGLVGGSPFAASRISRVWAGHFSDSRGTKPAVSKGLFAAALARLLYLLSHAFLGAPRISVTILLLGRAVLGGAESFIITGALGWGLALVDRTSAGKVMAWVGTAMYAAFALGAPAGTALCESYGFGAVALATTLIPLATLLLILPLRAVAPQHRQQPVMMKVASAIWVPGLGLAFSSIGFGAITTFVSLLLPIVDGARPGSLLLLSRALSSRPACSSAICPTNWAGQRSR